MPEADNDLKERVRAFWQAHPCGTKFADAPPGTPLFYERVTEHRYRTEWHIPAAADFAGSKGLRVLEIGCGLGTDGAEFAKAGADYTGVDLTEAAVDLARKRFELSGLSGQFRTADAENLDFADESFDLVYSHGVLHHTPDTAGAVREIYRVLKPGGRAIVMLYHRGSYNYRVNIRLFRRIGAHLLKTEAGLKLAAKLSGEPLESLREHARFIKEDTESYLAPGEFLNRNTDGAGNPLARVYSRSEARELFKDFAQVELHTHFLNKRWLPVVGSLLSRPMEARLAARWGWHLWIYAEKGNAGHRTQDTGHRIEDTGHRIQDTGVRSQKSGVRSQESEVRSQESEVRSQESGVRSQESGVRSQKSGVRMKRRSQPLFTTPDFCVLSPVS